MIRLFHQTGYVSLICNEADRAKPIVVAAKLIRVLLSEIVQRKFPEVLQRGTFVKIIPGKEERTKLVHGPGPPHRPHAHPPAKGKIVAKAYLGGLHHCYTRAA
jgi:O-acetyl-ADP-ribose deacetylase (regulator of RNase III)